MTQGINIIRIGWRAGRHWIWCYVIAGAILWVSAPPAAAQSTTASPTDTTAQPLATGSSLSQLFNSPTADQPPVRTGWQFAAKGGVDFTFTDNVLLTATNRQNDFIVTPQAVFEASDTTSRTALTAIAQVDYDIYTQNPGLSSIRPSAAFNGLVDVVEGELSVGARLATGLEEISPLGQTPATNRSFGANQTQVLSFGARPTWTEHFGDELQSQVFYDVSAVRFITPEAGDAAVPASDTLRQVASATLSNGKNFSRFGWSVVASYERQDPSGTLSADNPETSRTDAYVTGQYRITSSFSLTAQGGYEAIDDPTYGTDLNGPFGLAGFVWHPNERINFHAEAGYRYEGFDADATFSYSLGRSLNINLTYLRDLENSQRELILNLAGLANIPGILPATTASGLLGLPATTPTDPLTGLPNSLTGTTIPGTTPLVDPNQNAFGFANVSFRRDTAQASISGRIGRNSYSLNGSYGKESSMFGDADTWDAAIVLGRDLTPHLHVAVEAHYDRVSGAPELLSLTGEASTTKSASGRIDYRLGPTVTASLRYVHLDRVSTLASYRENAAVLGFVKTF